ncbi:MAG TPA: hypothetical protein VGJ79_08875 [Candidatus Dormibacteraeota bacterium]
MIIRVGNLTDAMAACRVSATPDDGRRFGRRSAHVTLASRNVSERLVDGGPYLGLMRRVLLLREKGPLRTCVWRSRVVLQTR